MPAYFPPSPVRHCASLRIPGKTFRVLVAMRIRTIFACSLGIAISACSSDRSYSPPGTVLTDTRVSEDLAVTAGMAAASSIDDQGEYLNNTGIAPSGAVLVPTTATAPNGAAAVAQPKPVCTYGATSGLWSCAPFVSPRGLTTVWTIRYSDKSGKGMQRYDSLATATIEYSFKSDGPVGDGTALSGMTHRTGEQALSGLLGNETTRAWNGAAVSVDTTTYSDASGMRRYVGVQVDSVKDVVYAQPHVPGSYPLSGRIVRAANFLVTTDENGSETRSVSRTITTTFNGTATVSIRIGALSCTLHLEKSAVDECSGR